jgi:hypothetical protein
VGVRYCEVCRLRLMLSGFNPHANAITATKSKEEPPKMAVDLPSGTPSARFPAKLPMVAQET